MSIKSFVYQLIMEANSCMRTIKVERLQMTKVPKLKSILITGLEPMDPELTNQAFFPVLLCTADPNGSYER